MKIRVKIKRLANLLDREYGKKIWRKSGDPTSVLIGTILSQNTTDQNSHRAFDNLKSRFKDWEEVRKSPVSKIERAIRIGGISSIKAKRIRNILNQIHNDDSDLSLSYLKRWETDRIISYLRRFKGVGDKTIACVLLFSLGRPIIPVDTHVLRLSKRLGLVPEDTDAQKAHLLLQKLVPENLVYSLHLNLIQHGRKVCQAQNPGCSECIVFDLCEYEEKKNHLKRGELTYAKGKYLRGGKKDKKALYAPAH
jgi:endonuclease-3